MREAIILTLIFVGALFFFVEILLYLARERCYYHDHDLNLIQEQYEQLKESKLQKEKRRSMKP